MVVLVMTSLEDSFQGLEKPIKTEKRTSENVVKAVGFFSRSQEPIHVRPE